MRLRRSHVHGWLLRGGAGPPLVVGLASVGIYSVGPVLVQASSVSGPTFAVWRLWIGVVVFGCAVLVSNRWSSDKQWPARWRQVRWAVYGGLAFGGHQLLFFSALKATSVTDVLLVGTLQPVAAAIGAFWLFGERPGLAFRVWTVVAMSGAAVLVLGGASGPDGEPLGMAIATLNVAFLAAFFLIGKRNGGLVSIMVFLFITMVVAACCVTLFAVAFKEPVADVHPTDIWLAVGPGLFGHSMMWAVRRLPANIPAVMKIAQPLLAGMLAWHFLGEPVLVLQLIGGAVILTGVAGAIFSPSGRAFINEGPGNPPPISG